MLSDSKASATAIKVGLVLLVLSVGLLVYPLGAQEASRMALTGALYEYRSIEIDGFPLGVDRSVKDGKTYSDKAPGQPILAIPAYALTQALGLPDARDPVIEDNLTLWLVTLASATIPTVALAVVGLRLAAYKEKNGALWSVTALITGTVILPFTTILFGHVLASLLLAAAFVTLRSFRPFIAGLLAGVAVTVEYTTAIGVAILLGWLIIGKSRSRAPLFVAGGVVPALMLGLYNQAAFGSPMRFSYQYSAFTGVKRTAAPILGIFDSPAIDNLLLLFVSGRGLFIATPIVVAGVIGTVHLLRDPRSRDLGVVCLLMITSFLLLAVFWSNPFGGDSPGPRYMAPALIFLAPGLACFWSRYRVLAVGLWLISVGTMVLAVFTNALAITRNDPAGIATWIGLAINGQWMPNIIGIATGWPGDVAFVVVASVSLAVLVAGMIRIEPTIDVASEDTNAGPGMF